MALDTLVKANDLAQWANYQNARSRLPLLLRRLVHATIDNIQRIGFPADEGIQTPGYDGFLVVEKGNAFIPDGCSVWEMGADKDIKGKADGDYEKRRNDPLDVNPAITTFTFVTPRRWSGKSDWVKERMKDNFWQDVRVYDADDLEQWLELTPSVHIWLSTLLGKHPETAEDISSFWQNWAGATRPALSPELLLVGREDLASRLNDWLKGGPSGLVVKADTREEAIAFFAANIYQKHPEERISLLSRIVLVKDPGTFDHLCIAQAPLFMVVMFNPGNSIGRAIQNGHSVYVSLGKGESSSSSVLELPRQHVSQIKDALMNLGIEEERAISSAVVARRSLMALRRKLAINPALHEPLWARPEHAREILPALLLGQWDETKDGDRSAVEKLTNTPYGDVAAILGRWANESDPPVRHIGNVWLLTSKEDAWNLLSRYIILDDLKRFESLAIEVLGEINPSLDLPVNERWLAALHGKVLSFSENLREGMADTLAIAGARSDATTWGYPTSAQDFVNGIVYKLLNPARTDWRVWASLSTVLRLFAEASPRCFLEAVDESVSGSPPTLRNIFEEPENVMFSGATYPGLLSALELLAWDTNYLSHVVIILTKLAKMDPGGKLQNRPSNSLKDIFFILRPKTIASLDQRLGAIDIVRARECDIAWKLMCDILPTHHAISMSPPTPRWRDWVPDTYPSLTWGEVWNATHEIVSRLLLDVGTGGNRWEALIKHIPSLPKEDAIIVVEKIQTLDKVSLTSDDGMIVWSALRGLISQYKRYPNTPQAMPVEIIDRLSQCYERLAPDDLISKYSWLFSYRVELIGDFGEDWRAHEQAVGVAKTQAAKEIFEYGGIPMICEMAGRVDQPYFLGLTIGQIPFSEQDECSLLSHLGSQHLFDQELLRGFIVARHKMFGRDWVQAKIDTEHHPNYSPGQMAQFFTYLPFVSQTWQILETFGAKVQETYWSTVRPTRFEIDDFNKPIQRLIERGRPHVALDIITMQIDKIGTQISAELTVECIEKALITKPEHESEWRVFDYVNELLDTIEKTGEIDEAKLVQLEFSLLPILSQRGERGPKHLHKALSQNPDLFIDAICLAYRAEGEEKQDISEEKRNMARLAHELIDGWKLIPGMEGNAVIDPVSLNHWVSKVRELALQNKRLTLVDLTIGQVFSYSPKESDGTWPAVPIRELLETISSDAVKRGFVLGVLNSRGVTWRGLLDGGAKERELAERYKQHACTIRDKWPVAASVLDRIADNYLSDAHREDLRAELEEDLW